MHHDELRYENLCTDSFEEFAQNLANRLVFHSPKVILHAWKDSISTDARVNRLRQKQRYLTDSRVVRIEN